MVVVCFLICRCTKTDSPPLGRSTQRSPLVHYEPFTILQHWAFYICSAWRKPVENTNRTHSSSHCPLPVLSQQCHSAQEQRPPFCLARGLKNQSHIQEIHPTRLSLTECLIVHGSAADLEGLPIFGVVEQPKAVACTDPRMNTQSYTIPQTKEELSRLGLRIHTKQPHCCVLPLHSRRSAL